MMRLSLRVCPLRAAGLLVGLIAWPLACPGDLLVAAPEGLFRFDRESGELIETVTTEGDYGALASGSGSYLLALDPGNARIDRYHGATFNFSGSFAEDPALADGRDLAVASNGEVYVAAGETVEWFGPTGEPRGTLVPGGAGGLQSASGVALGPGGGLYVADKAAGTILRFDATNGEFDGVVTTRTGVPGSLEFTDLGDLLVADDGEIGTIIRFRGEDRFLAGFFQDAGAPARLESPADVTESPRDWQIHVADRAGAVLTLDANRGDVIGVFAELPGAAGGDPISPNALAFSTLTPVEPATFADWREAYFSGDEAVDDGISGPEADPSGSGLPNLMRFALGLDPFKYPRNRLPVFAPNEQDDGAGSLLTFTRPRNLGGLRYAVEVSTDLNEWTEDTDALEVLRIENLGATERITVRDETPLGGENHQRFLRLRVNESL